jgi:hypothetical protein
MNPAIDRACIPIIDKIKLIYTRNTAQLYQVVRVLAGIRTVSGYNRLLFIML